ncbi:sulfite exporter TauE/SafE family protein [Paenibacillus polymyxa]|uniref:Probable membrane transporter protein n=1 Tax=Paenibacillus polymyxa TaxID=1406 RepID=A0A8I1IU89_PAEPO|nr:MULTISPECIES: sulfite exporter TauE/SafE family protein [Paenibacillus]KAF6575289.1 sulfite exporter TauE/SafE family protein [Paenibacillus sp. EKM206P]KAF6590038.1 sulfite exporter TauE/SafE family protein [Paenibacillus sp. EKM205P]MBM0632615.1 sulfite exporter TauE/SafE family protein [Paenibacillus polymyxa]
MEYLLFIVMIILGLVGSFFSGLLGIGGAIINYPLLMYVPSMLGVAHFSPHEVSSISMFQVFFASLAGVLAFRKKSKNGSSIVHKGLVSYMGSSILAGSLIGGFVSSMINEGVINLLYGILAVLAVILMLIPRRGTEEQVQELRFNKWIAVGSAFVVGIVSGIVGAGGAFILIPIMLTVLRIPTRTTIASSLAIVFISAIGGVLGKISGGAIPLLPTVFTVIGSVIGAPLGSKVSSKINVKVLRYGLVVLIALTAIKVWSSIL